MNIHTYIRGCLADHTIQFGLKMGQKNIVPSLEFSQVGARNLLISSIY